MLKKENGITLVALVITIIVLLILAGITLALVLGENGIFTKANNAKLETEISSGKDAVSMATLDVVTGQYSDTDGSFGATVSNTGIMAAVNGKLNSNGYVLTEETAGANPANPGTGGTNARCYVKKGTTSSSTYIKGTGTDAGKVLLVEFTVDSAKGTVKPTYSFVAEPGA